MNTSLSYMRIFEMDFFEKMSRWPWWYIFFFWIPVMTVSIWYSWWDQHLGALTCAFLFVIGFLAWGLVEYILHRFIFHWQPGGKVVLGPAVWLLFNMEHDLQTIPFSARFPSLRVLLFN